MSVGHAIVHAHAFATGDVLAEPISILDSSEHLLEHILPPHAKTEIVFVKDGVYFNNGCAYLTVSGENHLLGDHLLDVDQCPTTEDNVGSACISDIADFNVDADLAVKYAKFSAAIDMSESLSDSRISRMHTLPQTGEFMRLTTNGASMTSDSYKTYDHPLLYVNAFTESIRDVRQRASSSFDTSQVIHFFMSDVNSDDSRYRMNHSPPT